MTDRFPKHTTSAGTVYKITTTGIFTLLTTLPGPSISSLIQAKDGNFYGTSYFGGTADEGTVFKMTPEGNIHILHSFTGPDGAFPVASVIEVGGNLYGTTQEGGAYNNDGVIFRLAPDGFTVLHNFGDPNYQNDGIEAVAGLLQATDGNFYGATASGGVPNQSCEYGCGVIFQLTSEGTYSILHDFDGSDGTGVESTPVQHTNGQIYGLCPYGGTTEGVAWSLDMGLQSFVETVSKFGRVGQTGGILGQGLTGTTAVAIDGTPADFTVVSDTYMTATVPPGATTGYVTVTTPTGVLTSNVPFQVIQ